MFLKKRGDEVKIAEDVVKAIAGNKENGKAIMQLLLKKGGDNVKIIKKLIFLLIDRFKIQVIS